MTTHEHGAPHPPPPLPARFYEAPPVIIGGMILWTLAAVVVCTWSLLTGTALGEVFWTCVAGIGVGLFGAAIFSAQRAAARRGDRSAQQGVDPH